MADQGGLPACSPVAGPEPLSGDEAARLARLFKVLGDPVRLRLLSLIAGHADGEVCVCELTADRFAVTGPTISHHLRVLREAGLILGERRGTWIYYRPLSGVLESLGGFLLAAEPVPAA
ncbi:MAG: ArsR/SmtB family transcription factor [Pseudonocardia sp.]